MAVKLAAFDPCNYNNDSEHGNTALLGVVHIAVILWYVCIFAISATWKRDFMVYVHFLDNDAHVFGTVPGPRCQSSIIHDVGVSASGGTATGFVPQHQIVMEFQGSGITDGISNRLFFFFINTFMSL